MLAQPAKLSSIEWIKQNLKYYQKIMEILSCSSDIWKETGCICLVPFIFFWRISSLAMHLPRGLLPCKISCLHSSHFTIPNRGLVVMKLIDHRQLLPIPTSHMLQFWIRSDLLVWLKKPVIHYSQWEWLQHNLLEQLPVWGNEIIEIDWQSLTIIMLLKGYLFN